MLAFKSWNFCFCLLATGSSPTAIAALTSTVNRTTTNLQPLVPIGTQLQQPQFQVRMVQFPQQSGPAQIQQTIVQSPRGATTPVQIHTQQAQVVQGLQQVSQPTMGLLMSNGRYLYSSNKRTHLVKYWQTTAQSYTVESLFLNPPWLLEPSHSWTEPFNIPVEPKPYFTFPVKNTYFVPSSTLFSNLPRIWSNFLFTLWGSKWTGFHEIWLTFRLKILDLRDVLESSLFYLSYRRFSSMYSWNKLPWTVKYIVIQGKLMLVSQQGTSFIVTWDQALNYTKSDNFTNMYSFFRYSHRFKANP